MAGRVCPDHGPLPVTDAYCPNASCGKRAALTDGSTLFGGKYQITRHVAEGGMATIYQATNTQTGNTVAVKEPRVLPDPTDPNKVATMLAKFEDEGRMLRSVSSPNLLKCFDNWDEFGTKFMALEFINGQDFEQIAMAQGGTMTDDVEILRFAIAVCDGLAVLHAVTPLPIVHRDIKPANVMQDTTGRVVVMDLGISKQYNPAAGTATKIGTPGYDAWEQATGHAEPRSDLYSTAMSIVRLKLGPQILPLMWDERLDLVDQLPISWQGIMRRALAVEPLDRQADVQEFKQDLQSLLPAVPVPPPVTQPLQPRPWPQVPPVVVPPPVAVAPDPIRLSFDLTSAANHGRDHYRQAVAGTVYQGNNLLSNIQIIPYVMDFGSGSIFTGQRQTVVVSDAFGRFSLKSNLNTVPLSVDRREITLKVPDPATPGQPYERLFTIARPPQPKIRLWRGPATPITQQPVHQPGQPAPSAPSTQTARQKAAAQFKKAFAWCWSKKGLGINLMNFGLLIALVFLAITAYGITIDNMWVWTLAPLGIFLSLTAPVVFKKGFFARLARIVVFCIAIAWAGSWWIFYSAQTNLPPQSVPSTPATADHSGAGKKAAPPPESTEPKPKPFEEEKKKWQKPEPLRI